MGAESSTLVDSRGVKYSKKDLHAIIVIQALARMRTAKRALQREQKWKRHRERVLKELLSTEITYVSNLEGLVELYVRPLRDSGLKLMSASEHTILFSNVEKILNLHKELFGELVEYTVVPGTLPDKQPGPRPSFDSSRISIDSRSSRSSVDLSRSALKYDQNGIQLMDNAMSAAAVVLDKFAPQMKAYTDYVNNYDNALKLLGKFSNKEKVSSFFQKCKDNPSSGGLDLSSLLITPVQRIPRYQLLLQDMLKHSDEKQVHTKLFSRALNSIKQVAKYVNEMKREAEALLGVLAIQKTLRTIGQGRNLVKGHRKLIKEGNLVHYVGSKPKNRCCILFNDLLLLVSANSKKLGGRKIHFEMNVKNIRIEHDSTLPIFAPGVPPPRKDITFALSNEKNVTALFECTSSLERDVWTSEIKRAMNDTIERDVKTALSQCDRADLPVTFPLHCAAALGMDSTVNAFVNSGVDVTEPDSNGVMPLHYGADAGAVSIVHTLVQSGANMTDCDGNGATVLHYAAHRGHNEVLQWLITELTKQKTDITDMLNARTEDGGETALIWAVKNGHASTALLLHKLGSDFTICDDDGKSALHHAVLVDYPASCAVICELDGRILDMKDKYGRTSLHYAVMNRQMQCIPVLLKYGANVNCFANDGSIPTILVLTRLIHTSGNARQETVEEQPENKAYDISILQQLLKHGGRLTEHDIACVNSTRMQNGDSIDIVKAIRDGCSVWENRTDIEVTETKYEVSELLPHIISQRYEDTNSIDGTSTSHVHTGTLSLEQRKTVALSVETLENLLDSHSIAEPREWVSDSSSKSCQLCDHSFTMFSRRHHCRYCGSLVCSTCSQNRIRRGNDCEWNWISSGGDGDRLCIGCFNFLAWRSGSLKVSNVNVN